MIADFPNNCHIPFDLFSEGTMPPRVASSIPPSPPLKLRHTMAVIAALALTFAFLPIGLSVMWAVAVVGILVLQGLRLPLVTDGGGVRRWLPWMIWSLALAVCPIAVAIVGNLYQYT